MSRLSGKRRQKQAEREARQEEKQRLGQAVYVRYEAKPQRRSTPNRLCEKTSVAEELQERQDATEAALKVYRQLLPPLLNRLHKIPDLRKPGKVKHQKDVLLAYGILMFVYQMPSRRDANREMSKPIFLENIRAMFPEWETLPHADTLKRLLERIEVDEIQKSLLDLFEHLIRKKKFRQQLSQKRYLFAIDGTQKYVRSERWQPEWLERHVGEQKEPQYYVYVLEAAFILENGLTLPLLSEFLRNEEYRDEATKQDCETKAFQRLAARLKKRFPKLKTVVVLDGLYATGPIIQTCRQYHWDYMIVLKQDSLKSVWREFNALKEPQQRLICYWGDRQQTYEWVNDIEYEYGNRQKHREQVHVVTCQEVWQATDGPAGATKTQMIRYAWISNRPITSSNVFYRCTRMGRYRWKIENNFLVEKHHGYQYEHCFAYNWQAMLGYHFLMNIARFMHVLACQSEYLAQKVAVIGTDSTLKLLGQACTGNVLDLDRLRDIVSGKTRYYLKLIA